MESHIMPKPMEQVLLLDDPWDDIKVYTVKDISEGQVILTTYERFFEREPVRCIAERDVSLIAPYPFVIDPGPSNYPSVDWVLRIRELAAVEIQRKKDTAIEDLINTLVTRLAGKGTAHEVQWALRVWVKRGVFEPVLPKSRGETRMRIKLARNQVVRERQRLFSAGLGGELAALSERIGQIVSHAPTVGTYRESLLVSVLRRHLPERYHVATGFIYGLARQIDILIYDSVDHAPLFREGDLVVVPEEAVRAVIEVKTTLTVSELRNSISMLGEASQHDGPQPFFRGLFAFKAKISRGRLLEEVRSMYRPDPDDMAGLAECETIAAPFSHFSCICIHERDFLFSAYQKNEHERYVPYLYTKESALKLKSQASHFLQLLLRHLRVEGNPLTSDGHLLQMLGLDTLIERRFALVESDGWGAYFNQDIGRYPDVEKDVKLVEERIAQYQRRIHDFE
jgi:hypothetical protein